MSTDQTIATVTQPGETWRGPVEFSYKNSEGSCTVNTIGRVYVQGHKVITDRWDETLGEYADPGWVAAQGAEREAILLAYVRASEQPPLTIKKSYTVGVWCDRDDGSSICCWPNGRTAGLTYPRAKHDHSRFYWVIFTENGDEIVQPHYRVANAEQGKLEALAALQEYCTAENAKNQMSTSKETA